MTRVRMAKPKIASGKCCPLCGRTLPLTEFYPNKKWAAQIHRDLWCMECALRECKDEDGFKRYFHENNRKWNNLLFETAIRKAMKTVSTNREYVDPDVTQAKKNAILTRATASAFFSMMNLAQYYEYVDMEIAEVAQATVVTSASNADSKDKEAEPSKLEYSKRWVGYYTPEQLEILETRYDNYDRDFDLSDASMEDYALKAVKASFHADQVYDQMRRGEATVSDYKEATKIYDDLSKSSNFAACRRKPGDQQGMGSLGEIILNIESKGLLNCEKREWPQDSVDMVIQEYRHAIVAAGRDGSI